MPDPDAAGAILMDLDAPTRALVRLAAVLAAGSEDQVRAALYDALGPTPPTWIEELLLQTYLFAGFPRALNGMREWRRVSGRVAPRDAADTTMANDAARRATGEQTCAKVYGSMYERLRGNIRALHPALDDWMIVQGYGAVLSRPALDLGRRELCIVAACAASAQDRQLQSHLHGARNVGVPAPVIAATLAALADLIPAPEHQRATRLWERIASDVH